MRSLIPPQRRKFAACSWHRAAGIFSRLLKGATEHGLLEITLILRVFVRPPHQSNLR